MHLRLSDLREAQATGEAWVLVTIVETRGSTPRAVGASMLVFAQHTHGTIGGGELEFQATATARELLREGESSSEQHYVLGARLGQCCGGQANLWFESSDAWQTALPGLDNNKTYVTVTRQQEATRRFLEVNPSGQFSSPHDLPADVLAAIEACADPSCPDSRWVVCDGERYFLQRYAPNDFRVWLFGAGHVGQRVAKVLSTLPCEITWIDERPELLEGVESPNLSKRITRAPALVVDEAPVGTYFVVMTHSHALDADVCTRVLMRNDFAYAGLIGSRAKRASFEKRFARAGIAGANVARLHCPLGGTTHTGGYDKDPGVIAIGLAQELLAAREAYVASPRRTLSE